MKTCLADSATMHTILESKKYFSTLTMLEPNVNTISGSTNLIEGFGKANTLLIMLCSLVSQKETYWVSKIYVKMVIILKLTIKII